MRNEWDKTEESFQRLRMNYILLHEATIKTGYAWGVFKEQESWSTFGNRFCLKCHNDNLSTGNLRPTFLNWAPSDVNKTVIGQAKKCLIFIVEIFFLIRVKCSRLTSGTSSSIYIWWHPIGAKYSPGIFFLKNFSPFSAAGFELVSLSAKSTVLTPRLPTFPKLSAVTWVMPTRTLQP